MQHGGDIVAVVHYTVAVIRPARVEPVVADTLPVDVELIDSARGDIEFRALQRTGDLDAATEHRG